MKYSHGETDKIIKVEVNELDTVKDIKVKVYKKEGIRTHSSSKLKFHGKDLNDDRVLVSYCDIQDESILDLQG